MVVSVSPAQASWGDVGEVVHGGFGKDDLFEGVEVEVLAGDVPGFVRFDDADGQKKWSFSPPVFRSFGRVMSLPQVYLGRSILSISLQ